MSNANAELKYDRELPYVVEWQPGGAWARFHTESDAREYVEREGGTFVDTTPKPKIPEDAEFIYYNSWANSTHYARRVGHVNNHVWVTSNPTSQVSEDELLSRIGDAEVTVLVRKEES